MLSSAPSSRSSATSLPDVVVEAFDHRGVELHPAGFQAAVLGAQVVPAPREVGQRGNLGVFRDHPHALRARDAPLGQGFPAVVVGPRVEVEELVRDLERPVRRGVGAEGEERLSGRVRFPDVRDEFVRVSPGGVKALGERDDLAVPPVADLVEGVHGRGVLEVAGRPGKEHEGAVEPPVRRAVLRGLPEVPLAGDRGVVAGIPQDCGEVEDVLVEVTLVADPALEVVSHQARHAPEPGPVVVHPGKQHRPGRRAGGGGVEAREPEPGGGQGVQVRGADLAAEGADVGVAEVVGDQDQDVGRGRRRVFRAAAQEERTQEERRGKPAEHPAIMR